MRFLRGVDGVEILQGDQDWQEKHLEIPHYE
jgi:hypothetical protein